MTSMAPGRTTREALLDAAYDVVVAGNWETARMLDVAATAGVSRQTLYNEFGSKDALAEALAMREAQRFIEGNETVPRRHPSDRPVDAVAAVDRVDDPRGGRTTRCSRPSLTDDASEPAAVPDHPRRADHRWRPAPTWSGTGTEHWPRPRRTPTSRSPPKHVARLTVSYLVLPSDGPDGSAEAIAEQPRMSRPV